MERIFKPFVRVAIDGVDAVVHDAEGRFDAEHFDRYATFELARDAALCCIEDVLDEGDYEGEDHKAELVAMLQRLEGSESFASLESEPEYARLLERVETGSATAA